MVITISHTGYIKRIPITTYKRQRARGPGASTGRPQGRRLGVEHLFIASTHDYLLFFTNHGQLYWLKVHEIPQAGRRRAASRSSTASPIKQDEQIAALVPCASSPTTAASSSPPGRAR
jgi:DNA gyrase subunit A